MRNILAVALLLLVILSCKKQDAVIDTTASTPFANVVILGNSITYSPTNSSLGWTGSWGMAASTADKDYVHLLTTRFQQINKSCVVQAHNIAVFETNYDTYDFDSDLKTYRDSKPDLLILRIGENVQASFDSIAFAKKYQGLIAYMKTNNPNLKVLAVGSFWSNRDYINVIMSRYTPYISLAVLGTDLSNYAFDRTDWASAVQQHPGDKGMQGIADMIWAKVQSMK
ncbi:SGNH/GDSL hydrolase family protein [Mucilaginibacter jinjuensis]|uniref:SGNH/GDSL hydrolase family protein n=1 Tax=Mucilaginibacter jinjuensis TaxID=1176721 RepID=A0ABY7T7Q1_9SPHI|nr:SGNH/GDSL hydrolase family protein [Mucilaginibacter jinjuensis]WCT12268.1 SGNH/GDSL hydrolase family protein [Mucilaginibacter jinjuensis]